MTEMMKFLQSRRSLKASLKSGNNERAKHAAARILQQAWRSQFAKRTAKRERAQRLRLEEEAVAIKLQANRRARKARERMNALKNKQEGLREEGAAIMLQGAWRMRKARATLDALRSGRIPREASMIEKTNESLSQLSADRSISKIPRMVRSRAYRGSLSIPNFEAKLKLEAVEPGAVDRNIGTGKLQRAWRLRKLSESMSRKQQDLQFLSEEKAALIIQQAWRTRRLHARTYRLARIVQRVWRGRSSRIKFTRFREVATAVLKLQCLWRRKIAQRKSNRLRDMAIKTRAVLKLQKLWRAKLMRMRLDSSNLKDEVIAMQAKESVAASVQRRWRLKKFRERLGDLKTRLHESREERKNGEDPMSRIMTLNSIQGNEDDFKWLRALLLEKRVSVPAVDECVRVFRQHEINDEATWANIPVETFNDKFLADLGITALGVRSKLRIIHKELIAELSS